MIWTRKRRREKKVLFRKKKGGEGGHLINLGEKGIAEGYKKKKSSLPKPTRSLNRKTKQEVQRCKRVRAMTSKEEKQTSCARRRSDYDDVSAPSGIWEEKEGARGQPRKGKGGGKERPAGRKSCGLHRDETRQPEASGQILEKRRGREKGVDSKEESKSTIP